MLLSQKTEIICFRAKPFESLNRTLMIVRCRFLQKNDIQDLPEDIFSNLTNLLYL